MAFVTQDLLDRHPPAPARAPAHERPVDEVDPDLEWVDRWRAGDEHAFETLLRRHERRVFGLLMRMLGNRAEAEDVFQETFLNLHRSGHRFRRESRFSTFVYRVAVNAALNRRRSLGRRRNRLENLGHRQAAGDDLPSAPRGPDSAAEGAEIRERVQEEIQRLSPNLRAPLVMYDLEGLPYAEIAEALGLAEGTVKSRIHRARQALRERLTDLMDPGERQQ